MRKFIFIISIIISAFTSCQKEKSCEGCKATNKPPIAIAGKDTVIYLPVNSVVLNGSGSSDPDGTITGFQWRKISGPATFNLKSPNAAQSTVDSLEKGVYQFELKVTDNSGLSDLDTVMITVNDTTQPNRPPVANAGPDQTITLPTNAVNLDASSSSDPDNNIVSYLWKKISGPASFTIANNTLVQMQITNLTEGIYQFELKVTDAGGLFDKDTIQIEVKPEINQQNLDNICFYFPDPTGTCSFIYETFDTTLITVTINNLSKPIKGFWGEAYSLPCPFNTSYFFEPGENCASFNLPPGTYSWRAESSIIDLTPFPLVTGPIIQIFLSPHSISGTLTVNPGDSCIIQKIVFQ
jgi:hypothetical protein